MTHKPFTFEDVSEQLPDEVVPWLDKEHVSTKLTKAQSDWRLTGVVHLPAFIPDELIEAYSSVIEALNEPHGWTSATPYMDNPVLKDIGLYPPLMGMLKKLLGDEMGLHLQLTGWVSTQRNFHQDDYLNPSFINSHYAAVWIALDDIHPDSGPFQYVPGSHRWPVIRGEKLLSHYPPEMALNPAWPRLTQDEVAKCLEDEAIKRGGEIVTYLPKKGDVLIWHGRLMHRGSQPNVPGMLRKSLICHYSALSKREDMPVRAQHTPGCWYFVLPGGVNV
jgi:hypothetical protein